MRRRQPLPKPPPQHLARFSPEDWPQKDGDLDAQWRLWARARSKYADDHPFDLGDIVDRLAFQRAERSRTWPLWTTPAPPRPPLPPLSPR